jgi:hypothetical protein
VPVLEVVDFILIRDGRNHSYIQIRTAVLTSEVN